MRCSTQQANAKPHPAEKGERAAKLQEDSAGMLDDDLVDRIQSVQSALDEPAGEAAPSGAGASEAGGEEKKTA